jgi:hypothetical protein
MRTRARATVTHGENDAEEVTPHVEESAGRRDPEILAARESPERSLMRGRRRFGERGSGVEEDVKGYLHPDPLLL